MLASSLEWEPHWRCAGAGLGHPLWGQSEKHWRGQWGQVDWPGLVLWNIWARLTVFVRLKNSNRNDTCWQEVTQGKERKKKKWHLSVFSFPETVPPDPCPLENVPRLVSESLLLYRQCFSSCCFCPGTWRKWVCMWALYGQILDFPQLSGSPRLKFPWFLKPGIMGARLPGTGPLGWAAWHGSLAPQGSSTVAVSLPLWVATPRVCVLTRPHLCPSCPSQCGPFFVSSVIENLFSSLQITLRHGGSKCRCCFVSP